MVISNQKDLAKLLTLCRKHGVDSIEIDNIKLSLIKIEPKIVKHKDLSPSLDNYSNEDILNWSATALDGAF